MEIRNRLNILMESRIHGDVYVRFGGEYIETYRPKGRQGAMYLACGGGKTLIMCTAIYEMKRLGLAHKPMMIGLKANVQDLADTFRKAYPHARLLAPGKNDFTAAKRTKIFNDIKNNNWDCIILTHEQFGMIPQSDHIQHVIIEDELNSVEENLELARRHGAKISRQMEKGLIARKLNLEAKLEKINQSIKEKKDNVVDFKTMGIDHLCVDESHSFKNLMFTTRHDRVAGLGNQQGSQRALNLLFAIRTIQERTGRDLGATFLSGTTISNSLTELYTLFKYLRPKAMEKQGITTFDGWAAIYAKKSTEFEFSVTNELVQKERFRYFVKVPELAMFYAQITDYRTAADIGIERPEKVEQLIHIPPTPDQEEFIQRLMMFARTGNEAELGLGLFSEDKKKAKMLVATGLAGKMALDMRMIDPEYEDHPRSKLSVCAAKIAEYYQKYREERGTQFVFTDLGAYKKEEWSPCEDLKRKLIEDYNLPEHEIRFIQEGSTDRKKAEIIAAMNRGDIRVLIGGTANLGTGVNAQERAVAVHHIDIPWKPSDLEQRNGRAVRKGNRVASLFAGNKIGVFIYAIEKSLDSYRFNLLHNKQLFISQLKTNRVGNRMIDEGAMDENSGMNFSEYVAILSGNTDLLEKAKLDKKIGSLESERHNFERSKETTRYHLKTVETDLNKAREEYDRLKTDLDLFRARVRTNEAGEVINAIRLNGVEGSDPLPVGQKLKEINASKEHKTRTVIGTLYGFDTVVRTEVTPLSEDLFTSRNKFGVVGQSGILYTHNNGIMAENPELAAASFLRALEKIAPMAEKRAVEIRELEPKLAGLEALVNELWGKEDQLLELKIKTKQLDDKIKLSIGKEEEEPEADIHTQQRYVQPLLTEQQIQFNLRFIPLTIGEYLLNDEEKRILAKGQEIFISEIKDRNGKVRDCYFRYNFEKNRLDYRDKPNEPEQKTEQKIEHRNGIKNKL